MIEQLITSSFLIVAVLLLRKFAFPEKADSSETEMVEMSYTIRLEKVRSFTLGSLHQGDRFYDGTVDAFVGEVEKIESEAYCETRINEQGETVQVEVPGYYTVLLTLRGEGLDKEDGYYLSGLVELKSGSKFLMYSKYIELEGEVCSIALAGEKEAA